MSEALDRLEQGWRRVRDEARGPGVHVACSATFATRWLAPRLADFYRAHPEIRVRLSMTSAREMRDEGADLVIAWDWKAFPPPTRPAPFRWRRWPSVRSARRAIRSMTCWAPTSSCPAASPTTSPPAPGTSGATRRAAGSPEPPKSASPHPPLHRGGPHRAGRRPGGAAADRRRTGRRPPARALRLRALSARLGGYSSGERYQSASAGLFIDWLATALTAG
uniref:LysR substrate-binding domain-containing protein n=1 Tax=Phenylobacterium glaciei TaxID=2803784 RepID=A0A974P530_9CAUL|nr:hypothetical protein JKL49_05575 [Phenylobacterium glaciei]